MQKDEHGLVAIGANSRAWLDRAQPDMYGLLLLVLCIHCKIRTPKIWDGKQH